MGTEPRPSPIRYERIGMVGMQHIQEDFYLAAAADAHLRLRLCTDPGDFSGGWVRMSVIVEHCGDRVSSRVSLLGEGAECARQPLTRHHFSGALQEYILCLDEPGTEIHFAPHRQPGPVWIRSLSFHSWSETPARGALAMDTVRRWWDPVQTLSSPTARALTARQPPSAMQEAHLAYWNAEEEPVTNRYSRWARYSEAARVQRQRLSPQTGEPILFSLILPIFNTKREHLRACVDSVRNQTYRHWELCMVDDASVKEDTLAELKEIVALDPRFRLRRRQRNGHICEATNDALAMAKGDFLCLLDHDDTLAAHALARVAQAMQENPDAVLIYSDEDNLDEQGNRVNPHFKSGWNRHLLYSHNYITHFLCVEAGLARSAGGMRKGVEGAQDYDFILRVSETLKPGQIQHIPEILYHWRRTAQSTASSHSAKPYTVESGRRALQDHFRSRGETERSVQPLPLANFYQTSWQLKHTNLPRVCVLIPTRDNRHLLEACVRSLLDRTSYPDYTILIIDNGSSEQDTLSYLDTIRNRQDEKVRVCVNRTPFNFSRLINYGVNQSEGDLICLLNDDTEVVHGDWLMQMVSHAVRPEVGCVGAKLLYADQTLQHAGLILSPECIAIHSHRHLSNASTGYFNRPHLLQEVSAVTGACLLVRRELYEKVNGLDEVLFGVAYNDIDFCLKLRSLGHVNLYVPQAVLIHHESRSRGYEDNPEKLARLEREQRSLWKTWGTLLMQDPYYNPNLSTSREDFAILEP